MPLCHSAEHLFAASVLAGGERRGGEVDDDIGVGGDELFDRIVMVAAALPEVAIVPDVFADADPDAAASDVEDLRAMERFEVPILVEDVVGWQERFAKPLLDARSEERRVGKECRSRWTGHQKKKKTRQDMR